MTITMPAHARSRPVHRSPAPVPEPLPAALAGVIAGALDPAPTDGTQAQGDVLVVPWETFMSPEVRHRYVRASRPLPRAGVRLLGSHLLLTDTGTRPARWLPARGGGPGLGTLVVPAGTLARLSHEEHAALRVGPGVYAVRRQRIHDQAGIAWVID